MTRLGLIAVLLAGLVITTPVVCVCDPVEHGGLALHSLLPHSHSPTHPHADHHGRDGFAEGQPSKGDSHPRITAQSGAGAGALASTGAIGLAMTPPWRITPAASGWPRTPPLLVASADDRPPPGPPPRLPAR